MSSISEPHAAGQALGLGTKLFYGIGSIAYGVKDQGFSYLLLLYYNQVLHVPASDVGLALLIVLAVDACYDPIIGHWSDNFHSRWGRRHPFMYATALPVSLCYLLLWQPPASFGPRALFYYLIAVAIVVRFFITLYEIPSSALAPELTENYHDRTQLLGFRTLFQWLGGLALAFLALSVFLVPDADHPFGQLNPAGYADYGWAAGAAMLTAILISAAGTHRHIPNLRPPPPKRRFVPAQVARDIIQILSRRALLVLLGAGLFAGTAIGLAAALTNYFLTFFWALSADQIAIVLASYLISAFIALPGATILSRRFGKKWAAIMLWSAGIVLGPLALLLRLAGWFPANGDPALVPILFIHGAVTIALFIANNILVASMIADVVEAGQIETGRRAEGLFFAANSFIQKFTSGIGIYSAGLVLALIGFPEGVEPGQVPPDVLSHLVEVYVPVITLLFLGAIGFVQAYPIDRATHEANLARLGTARGSAAAAAAMPETIPTPATEPAAIGL